ncbi:MAG: DUF167 domain-containing protein [Thermodesulfobacteriota bacterium]
MDCLQPAADGVLLLVHAQPRAASNRLMGLHDRALRIGITAPPLEGRANVMLAAFLADLFDLPKSAVRLTAGDRGRKKRFLLQGLSREQAETRLAAVLPKTP